MGNAGEGRVLECLRDHRSSLEEECRKEELKLAIIQSRDVRLRPKLHKACSEEMAIFCKDVAPGMSCRLIADCVRVLPALWLILHLYHKV